MVNKDGHRRNRVFLLITGLLITAGCGTALTAQRGQTSQKAYDLNTDGELVRPTDYRSWIYVGTPVTPNDMNNGKAAFPEHHNVYIDRDSYQHYLSTGEWREGTILVKELVSVGTKQAVSGNGYFQGEYIGLEATIKSKADFPGEPGNWAYFSFTNHDDPSGDLASTAAAFPASSCNACHAASAQDDFVFTQHYPVLRAAKNAKTTPENKASRPKTIGDSSAPNSGASVEITFDQSGRDEVWQATAATPSEIEGTTVPTNQDELFAFLKGKSYASWDAKESSLHPSRGPHTNFGKPVRVFMNETLAESMGSGNREHPIGSTAVKEMYDDAGVLAGWAVEIKTKDQSDGGDGWFWYEVTSTETGDAPFAIGNGVSGCYTCHSGGGHDYVKSNWPLD